LQDKHSIPKADEVRPYQGALSWGNPGIYKHVFKVDCQSMYPSIIINYSVYNKEKDPNGYLLELVKIFREKRLEYKKLAAETNDSYWKQMDTTAKGYLNSFYGFYGAAGLNFNSFDCADFITSKGREILSKAIVWATSKDFKDLAPEYFDKDTSDV
jgi:DNA polymerase elongation subunit (family B)